MQIHFDVASLWLLVAFLSLSSGWIGASLRFMELSGRVSEMEAAVVRYWDRVRKRMTVEREQLVRPPADPFADIIKRNALDVPLER